MKNERRETKSRQGACDMAAVGGLGAVRCKAGERNICARCPASIVGGVVSRVVGCLRGVVNLRIDGRASAGRLGWCRSGDFGRSSGFSASRRREFASVQPYRRGDFCRGYLVGLRGCVMRRRQPIHHRYISLRYVLRNTFMVLVVVATGFVRVQLALADEGAAGVATTGSDWLDTTLKVVAILFGGTGLFGVFSKFWGRDRAEGEKNRHALLEDRARRIRALEREVEELRFEREVLREDAVRDRTRIAGLEFEVEHWRRAVSVRTTAHDIHIEPSALLAAPEDQAED